MTEQSHLEQRRHPRIKVAWKAIISCTDKSQFTAKIDNISRGGGHFLSPRQLPKGSTVLLQAQPLIKGQAYPVKVILRIAHTHLLTQNQGVGTGFSFVTPPESLVRLIRLLEANVQV